MAVDEAQERTADMEIDECALNSRVCRTKHNIKYKFNIKPKSFVLLYSI